MSDSPHKTRKELFTEHFPTLPKFRWSQIEQGLFQVTSWKELSTLSQQLRSELATAIPWISITPKTLFESKNDTTVKIVFKTHDGLFFESVLIPNATHQYTLCVSSQVGCPMQCSFCATGAMGFTRDLTNDEIVDQLRYFQLHLPEKKINNMVFMGMGEPLANYENVKDALNTIIRLGNIARTHITVSTVGILSRMKTLLYDQDWPNVPIAISLHSPKEDERKKIVPSTIPHFHTEIAKWSHDFARIRGNRNVDLTFEYTLISKVNDSDEYAHELGKYMQTTAIKKLNVIPLNETTATPLKKSETDRIKKFKKIIESYGLDVFQRRTRGEDIMAACGQLAVNTQKKVIV